MILKNSWNLCDDRFDSWTSSCIRMKPTLSLKILRTSLDKHYHYLSKSWWLPLTYVWSVHEGHSTTWWSEHFHLHRAGTVTLCLVKLLDFSPSVSIYGFYMIHDLAQSTQGMDERLGQIEKMIWMNETWNLKVTVWRRKRWGFISEEDTCSNSF